MTGEGFGMEQLSVNEYANLRGCSERYVRQLITEGKINAVEEFGLVGSGGKQYRIPLASIEPKLISKYERINKKNEKKNNDKKPAQPELVPIDMEQLTETERQEVIFWKNVLIEWSEYRHNAESKKKADDEFVSYLNSKYSDKKFNLRLLYRKQEALRTSGENALIDMRGKHGNHKRAVPKEVFDIFEYYYLDQSKKTIAQCVKLTQLQLQHDGMNEYLPLASPNSFAREVDRNIPVPVLKYFRLGEKAFKDDCMSYIKRTYDDLRSNDIWVTDNHTYDIFIEGEDKSVVKPIRVYLTAFLDVRSRKMVGWYVTHNPSSDATLQALRRGIEKYGIPKRILSDNGREFLTHDIGGRGFRKNGREGEHEAPTILDHLRIEFRTAMVKNARAKIVERAFREVKECFSRLFAGYTGGTIAERPERLKELGKKASNFTPYTDFVDYVDIFIQGWFNYQEHSGIGMKGKTRNQVYQENLYEQRLASQEDLNLMMMRNSRMITVRRDGVVLKIYDTEIPFNSDQLLYNHIGEKVYFRFNPDDLSEVRIYDEFDRFLCTAQQKTALSYFATKEQVAEKMREQRTLERTVKAYKKQKGIEAEDALALIMAAAEENMKREEFLDPKIITPIRMDEKVKDSYANAVGYDNTPIDWTEAIERMKSEKTD